MQLKRDAVYRFMLCFCSSSFAMKMTIHITTVPDTIHLTLAWTFYKMNDGHEILTGFQITVPFESPSGIFRECPSCSHKKSFRLIL